MERKPLNIPIIAFDGRRDNTIARGNVRQWRRYTTGRFRCVPVAGDHYFVASHFHQASVFVGGRDGAEKVDMREVATLLQGTPPAHLANEAAHRCCR